MKPVSATPSPPFESTLVSKVDSIATTAQTVKSDDHSAFLADQPFRYVLLPSPSSLVHPKSQSVSADAGVRRQLKLRASSRSSADPRQHSQGIMFK
jgi:hypothetical protein